MIYEYLMSIYVSNIWFLLCKKNKSKKPRDKIHNVYNYLHQKL